jgi:hypothetical protein
MRLYTVTNKPRKRAKDEEIYTIVAKIEEA